MKLWTNGSKWSDSKGCWSRKERRILKILKENHSYLTCIFQLMIEAFPSNILILFVKLFISWIFVNYVFICNTFPDFWNSVATSFVAWVIRLLCKLEILHKILNYIKIQYTSIMKLVNKFIDNKCIS